MQFIVCGSNVQPHGESAQAAKELPIYTNHTNCVYFMKLYRLLLYYALFNKNYYIRILIKDLSFEACMHCACASKLKIDALPTMSFEVGTPTTTTGLAAAGEPSTAAKQPIIFSDP